MMSLNEPGKQFDASWQRPFVARVAAVCVTLAVAGLILAHRFDFDLAVAVPVVMAFCVQAALYCVAVSNSARRAVREAGGPTRLGLCLVVACIAPYAVYSLPTGVFAVDSFLKLVLLCATVVIPYVAFPVSRHRFVWQDALVVGALAFPMISGVSTLFRDVYQGFDPPANRLDALGKFMLIPLGLFVFLEFRRLAGTGFRLLPTRKDWRPALDSAGYALPWMLLVGLSTGYLQWDPPTEAPLRSLAGAAGKLVGIYLTTAMAEEFLLRGVVQNLAAASTGRPLLAQALSAALFGAAHLGRGGFPNLPYAATASVLGWFCGRAYAKSGTVTSAMIAHALAVAGQELFFR